MRRPRIVGGHRTLLAVVTLSVSCCLACTGTPVSTTAQTAALTTAPRTSTQGAIATDSSAPVPASSTAAPSAQSSTGPAVTTSTAGPTPTALPTSTVSADPVDPVDPVDPRWRFYTSDTSRYASAWFPGNHRVMVPFGCSSAPYYDHDPRCPGTQGFHHGVDVVMPCGTALTSNVDGVVAPATGAGALGAAYGLSAFRIRDMHDFRGAADIVIGHVRAADVRPGQRVVRGQRIAPSGDDGAPDGCHLHFEVRSVGGAWPPLATPDRSSD